MVADSNDSNRSDHYTFATVFLSGWMSASRTTWTQKN